MESNIRSMDNTILYVKNNAYVSLGCGNTDCGFPVKKISPTD